MASSYAQKFILGMLGLLGLSIAVNVAFFAYALKTDDGLVDEQYVDHELRYDQDHQQYVNLENWRVRWVAAPRTLGSNAIVVRLGDSRGSPLEASRVELELFRPTLQGHDRRVLLHETAPGEYRAALDVPLVGLWDTHLSILRGAERYVERRRVRIALRTP